MKSFSLYTFIFISVFVFGQNQKLNTSLLKVCNDLSAQNKIFRVLIKGNTSLIHSYCSINGGNFNYAYGDIACVSAKVADILVLSTKSYVQRIELPENRKLGLMNDTMRVRNNINPIHLGAIPLTQSYFGQGIILGMIDSGHDFNHPDFKDPLNGNSRIMKLWDQNFPVSANTPLVYGYGQEWDSSHINSNNCPHTDILYYGHGTHTAGIAGGNGGTTAQCIGVAPKVDFVSVGLNFNSFGPVISDAVHYIFSNATTSGKPCVINASVGDYYGSHDGKDLQSQIIDAMLQTPGRLLVGAAGNSGSYKYHIGYPITNDTNFTFISSSSSTLNFQLYSEVNQFLNVNFRIGANDANFNERGITGFKNFNYALGLLQYDTIYNNGNRLAVVQTAADTSMGVYTLDVTIYADSSNYKWRLDATGTGRFDSWNFDYLGSGLPSVSSYPKMINYKYPDSLMTIVSGFQCLDNVVTVGNYINMTSWYDVNNTIQTIPYTTGQISSMSSQGPTRDGRIKPDITASGDQIFSSGVLSLLPGYILNNPANVSQDSLHVMGGGTSSSAPVVAGIGALFLEMNPSSSPWLFKQAVSQCAKQDNFTGSNLPNTVWGYGKLDGFGTVTCGTLNLNTNGISSNEISFYPNPATSKIIFEMKNNSGNIHIRVLDFYGREVSAEKLEDSSKEISISVDRLSSGIYFCILEDRANALKFTGKFVKQ